MSTLCAPHHVSSTFSREMIVTMIVQREERSLETSVNKLLSAGSRMSVVPFGAFPVFERASILRSASRMSREFPCRGFAPAVARDYFHRTLPRCRTPWLVLMNILPGSVRGVVGIMSGIISENLMIAYYAERSNC
jgi:hypothetical protein